MRYPTSPMGRRYLLKPRNNPEQMAVANLSLIVVGIFSIHETILPCDASRTVTHFSPFNQNSLSIATRVDHENVLLALNHPELVETDKS